MISLFFIIFSLIHFGQAGTCTFNTVNNTAKTNPPLYIKITLKGPYFKGIAAEGSEVLYPAGEDKTIEFKSYNATGIYSKLLLECPGEGNIVNSAMTKRGENTVELFCESSGRFLHHGAKVTVKNLACVKPVTLRFELRSLGTVRHLFSLREKSFCDKFKRSKAAHLVYWLTKADGVREVVPRVCLDETTNQPLFTFHRIQKEHLSSGRTEKLVQLLARILRIDDFVEHPMVPKEELISFPGIEVDKTDLYRLTVPMFTSISENYMDKVENFIRSKARENEEQFTEVFTVLIDLEGVEKLYVTENNKAGRQLLVPLIVAKIIKTKKFCLGLLVVNRIERVREAESICISECKKHSPKFGKKHVLCCPYSSISRYIPEDLQSTYLKQCNS